MPSRSSLSSASSYADFIPDVLLPEVEFGSLIVARIHEGPVAGGFRGYVVQDKVSDMSSDRKESRVLLLFVDGVGLAPASESNPLATVPTPAISTLLGGPLTEETYARLAQEAERDSTRNHGGPVLVPLDARLGVEGLPQSATGQTALFTGVNAPARLGRHVSAFPGPRLRALIEEHGLLGRARRAGLEVTFANAYTEGYFERVRERRSRHSATTLTAMSADLTLRDVEDLRAGEAVSWDVTGHRFGGSSAQPMQPQPLPTVTAEEAGRHLASLAARHRLTLWETFLSDLAGHRRFEVTAEEALGRIDGLLGGVLAHRAPELTVVLTSDHGNLEDPSHTVHTTNPVPLMAVGPHAERFRPLRDLTEVTPTLLALLGVDAPHPSTPN